MKKILAIINAALGLVLVVSCVSITRTDGFKQAFGLTENTTQIQIAVVGFDNASFSDIVFIPPVDDSAKTDIPEPPFSEVSDLPIDYFARTNALELPINGASGYASIALNVYGGPFADTTYLARLSPGQGFTILREFGQWWEIEFNQTRGWVEHTCCLINLPDVIPSIVYNNTNVFGSKLRSSGYVIPDVTGMPLYDAFGYNARLGENQYIVPVLYSMAKKICRAQHAALADGNTLIIYEAFRPYETQQRVYTNLTSLIKLNSVVADGVSTSPWSIGWFIAQGTSNHQMGYAIDVSLGRVLEQKYLMLGNYVYPKTTSWEEYDMPTPMHELSAESAVFTQPINPNSTTAWQSATLTKTMNNAAILLQRYCTSADLTPLASEWWHFNDNASRLAVENRGSNGNYLVSRTYSIPPQN